MTAAIVLAFDRCLRAINRRMTLFAARNDCQVLTVSERIRRVDRFDRLDTGWVPYLRTYGPINI